MVGDVASVCTAPRVSIPGRLKVGPLLGDVGDKGDARKMTSLAAISPLAVAVGAACKALGVEVAGAAPLA